MTKRRRALAWRLLLSLIGGVAIPFVYALIFAPLSAYVEDPSLRAMMGMPVRWPYHLYILLLYVFLPPQEAFLYLNQGLVVAVIITGDVLLYGGLTFALLSLRALARGSAPPGPPPPPRVDSPRRI